MEADNAVEESQANHSILLEAVRQSADALKYAADELEADRDFMRSCEARGLCFN